MRDFSRAAILAATSLTLFAVSSSDSPGQDRQKDPAGSLGGRVMLGDKPVPRAVVILTQLDRGPVQRAAPMKATTDEEGRYRINGIPAGGYTVLPFTPAFVLPTDTSFGQPGKAVALRDDEQVEDIDFSLTRGGVITGRIADADGRPLVEQTVNVMRVDERGQRVPTTYFNPFSFRTDDRGVYRVYGLTPGRYKVSVGDAPESGVVRIGFGGGVYTRTFHPDVTDESKAVVVEVKAGGEAADIDIKMGRASKTFVATGRIVEADSGKPLANLQYGHGALAREQTSMGGFGWTGNKTSANGEFRIEGLGPGRYAAFVIAIEQVDFYSEPAVFEVNDSDVTGLEIKVHRGSSITGSAVIEGANDSEALTQMSRLELRAFVRSEQMSPPMMGSVPIKPDGSFLITGLRPGKVRISLGGFPTQKGFSLLRVEREGVDQRDGIDINPGEVVSGVRVVIGYGTGVVRGDVKVQNGRLAPDTRLRVSARRLDGQGLATAVTVVDARGRFSLEGLIPGEYELALYPMVVTPSPPGPPAPGRLPPKPLAKQNVSVSNGTETEVRLIVDLAAGDKEADK